MPRREITYLQGIREGLQHVLRTHPETVLFGEDVAAFGGAFKMTTGFLDAFGADRVFDTPIAESAMLGAAIGMATQGLKPIVELQFADFATTALHQLLNNAGTLHYRTGVPVPLTVRAPCGGGFGGGPFHSEELEAIFCHMPGIKVVYPAFPSDARSLIVSAVLDPNPVIFLENKFLYRHVKEDVETDIAPVPLGCARICRPGTDATVVTYGAMVHTAIHAAETVAHETGAEVMVLDLRSLKPLDTQAILAAAATGRVLVLHEAWRTCGLGAEVAALIAEQAFHHLDAPVRRLTAPDCPVPFAPELEAAYRPDEPTVTEALLDLLET
ncbi:MAG TPA: transketolase C-terminal domain-containing protein [Kiritimatiellia bacterium]|nr:transketolase C-terminal domain-containing protein [Kiritimatiellia bacterium]HMP32751.1 transketolase C-terminal domain-containing protein [Kiritimatiellia bacterium]